MASAIWFAMRRRVGLVSGKFLSQVAGSALAIVAVTTLSGQFRAPPMAEGAPMPTYRPTLDPITGKIVDRLPAVPAAEARIGQSAAAAFLGAPRFVAANNIAPWSTSRFDTTLAARSRAITVASVESPRATLAEPIPLPPSRTIAAKDAPPTQAASSAEEAKPSRLAQAAAWLSPGRMIDSGAEVLASGRETIARAVSYGGDALGRIYR